MNFKQAKKNNIYIRNSSLRYERFILTFNELDS